MSTLLRWNRAAVLAAVIALSAFAARAEILQLVNGDQYRGTVLGMNASNIVFQSEIQGRVILPRNKVAQIVFHEVAVKPATVNTNAVKSASGLAGVSGQAPLPGGTNDAVLEHMRQQGIDPKIVDQVQSEVFGKSSPAAAAKYNELMGGLMSGRLGVQDIRSEAQKTISQVKAMKKDLGDDTGDVLDGYLAILERFVAESSEADNQPVIAPKPAPAAPANRQ